MKEIDGEFTEVADWGDDVRTQDHFQSQERAKEHRASNRTRPSPQSPQRAVPRLGNRDWIDPSFSKDIEFPWQQRLRRGGQIVLEFARQVAEAHLDLVRIRELRAERLVAVFANPEAMLEDYSKLDENLAQLERYERRAFSQRKRALLAMSKQ